MSKRFSLAGRLASFRFAIRGLILLVTQEHNARVHLAASVAVVVSGLGLGISRDEWRWIVLAIALVWMAEAFNTAIERMGDAITLERDERIGVAKDVAAAAVLVASGASAIIGITVFLPYLTALASA